VLDGLPDEVGRDPSVKDGGEVAAALGVDVELGLASQEASRRLAQDGLNELPSKPVPGDRKNQPE
jgi:Cation transporter/ATPase, N-terminus